jgi:hypothetical protein
MAQNDLKVKIIFNADGFSGGGHATSQGTAQYPRKA